MARELCRPGSTGKALEMEGENRRSSVDGRLFVRIDKNSTDLAAVAVGASKSLGTDIGSKCIVERGSEIERKIEIDRIGGGHVTTSKARDLLAEVAAKDTVDDRGFLARKIEVAVGADAGALHFSKQAAEKLVCIFLAIGLEAARDPSKSTHNVQRLERSHKTRCVAGVTLDDMVLKLAEDAVIEAAIE